MNLGRQLVILCIRIYKLVLSPVLHFFGGPLAGCRYTPTCSVYAAEAVALHGVIKGTLLAVSRVCRCHPWGGCGEDAVPEEFRLWRMPTGIKTEPPLCCPHVATQHATHFGCPPPVR